MAKSTQCTIFCAASKEEAWNFNLESTRKQEVFNNDPYPIERNHTNLPEELFQYLETQDNNKLSLEDFQKMPWYQYYKRVGECVPSHDAAITIPEEKETKISDENTEKDPKALTKSNLKEHEKQINKTTSEESQKEELLLPNENLSDNAPTSYTRECFDGIYMRFEEPQSTCRWDSPLFVVYPNDKLDCDAIYDALFKATPLVPNQSTQNVSCI